MQSAARRLRLLMGVLWIGLFAVSAPGQGPAKKTGMEDSFLDLPTAERLFRVQSETDLRAEIRAEGLKRGAKKVDFPADFLTFAKAADFAAPAQAVTMPVSRVCFNTLYYQDVRTERRLLSCGPVEPLRSAFLFYGKTLALPALMVAAPPWRLQCWDYPFQP